MKTIFQLFVALPLLWTASHVMGQTTTPWQVSAAKKTVKNPVAASAAVVEKGKSLYNTHCKSCHGDPGKNNGLPLQPKPTDPASAQYQAQTDGEMFYKMMTGRGAMPKFADVISETDKWSIIHYVRTFGKKKSSADAIEVEADTLAMPASTLLQAGVPIQLNLHIRERDTMLIATLTTVGASGEPVPAAGVEVAFFVKRYFGDLPLGEGVQRTDVNGWAAVELPVNLPGDTAGMLTLIAKAIINDGIDNVSDTLQAAFGKPLVMRNITEERSLWGRARVAPLYIIITFFGALLIVWGTMGYVVMNVLKINRQEA